MKSTPMHNPFETLESKVIIHLARKLFKTEQGKEPTAEQVSAIITAAINAVTKE